jgi:hypothetical protein
MKYSCAIQFEGCYETTIGFRGICLNCYNALKDRGVIKKGDKFSDFPLWLKEMVRWEAAGDMSQARHPIESYDDYEEFLLGSELPTATRTPLGNGCFKARRLAPNHEHAIIVSSV